MHLKKTSIALGVVVFLSILLTCIPFSSVSARTNGVIQSRRVASVEEFPESYQPGLLIIKGAYPNAQFIYYDTGLTWEEILSPDNELYIRRNLVPSYEPSSWKSIDPSVYDPYTDTYYEIEPGWNAASKELIEYYMDPRNFFDEDSIFQFLQLSYNGSETIDGVESIIHNSFMSNQNGAIIVDENGASMTYAQAFMKIGKITGVSPYMLATRVLQEQGPNGSVLCSGTCALADGAYYGYYDFFNMRASGSTKEQIITNGLAFAKSNGWDTVWKSLLGGAKLVASNYVGSGKDTLYLQHWNFVADSSGSVSYIPYMTSTITPSCEAKNIKRSCTDHNANYTFVIPVFKTIPNTICPMPSGDGSGSPILKNIAIGGQSINFSAEQLNYEIAVDKDVSFVFIEAEAYSNVNISLNGVLKENSVTSFKKGATLSFGENIFSIQVVANGGRSRTYSVKVFRDSGNPWYSTPRLTLQNEYVSLKCPTTVKEFKALSKNLHCSFLFVTPDLVEKKDDEYIATNDSFVVKDENGKIVYQNKIILSGDVNADGIIDIKDTQSAANDIFGKEYLTGLAKLAADIDNDGSIGITDVAEIAKALKLKNPDSEDEIAVKLVTDKKATTFSDFVISLQATVGKYVSEGYLIYNNKFFEIKDTNNDGSVHFLVVDGTVFFENGKNEISLKPLVADYDYTISTKYLITYQLSSDDFISIGRDEIKGTVTGELYDLVVENNVSNASDQSPILTLKLVDSPQTFNKEVDLTLPEGFYFDNNQKTIKVSLEEEPSINIYKDSKIIENNFVHIDSRLTENFGKKFDFEYTVTGCNHYTLTAEFNDLMSHSFVCSQCDYELRCPHNFVCAHDDVYKCVDCGAEEIIDIDMSVDVHDIGEINQAKMRVLVNAAPAQNARYCWFMDGKSIGTDSDILEYRLKDNNIHMLYCFVMLSNGTQLIQKQMVQAKNTPLNISVLKISCDRILLNGTVGAQYKIDGRKWQSYPIFSNLKPETTYTIRIKTAAKVYTIKLTTQHNYTDTSFHEATCLNNAGFHLVCADCEKTYISEVTDTKLDHNFHSLTEFKKATCKHGTIYSAMCTNGCQATKKYVADNIVAHNYQDFIYNNDATCTINGTETGFCTYCHQEYNRRAKGTATGHSFTKYTIEDCNRIAKCSYGCGKENILKIVNKPVTCIDLQIGDVVIGKAGLTDVQIASDGLVYANYELMSKNEILTKDSKDAIIQPHKQYLLISISLQLKNGYCFGDDIVVYINGTLSHCKYEIKDNVIRLKNLGRFNT